MTADKTGGAGNQDGEAIRAAGGGGESDLLLPGGAGAVKRGRQKMGVMHRGIEQISIGADGRVVDCEEEDED